MSEDRSLRELEVAAATGRRSPLFLWMVRHHDEFAGVIRRSGRPNWGALARKFGELGLHDRMGHAPTAEGARQTWVKVRKMVEREAKSAPLLQQSAAQPRDENFSGSPVDDDHDFSDIEGIT